MKRCPECGREYDNTMMFCLDDGSELLYGPASGSGVSDEPATAILHTTDAVGDAPTREHLHLTGPTAVYPPGRTDSGNDDIVKAKTRKYLLWTIFAVIVLAVAGTGYVLYKTVGKRTDISFESAKLTRITSSGKATHASISPDGKYIVHVVSDAGKQSLWMRQTLTGSNVQIVEPAEVDYWGLTFSRDGNYVYYVSRDVGTGTGLLFRVPVLGGTPVKLVTDVDSSVTISPDSGQIAFVRWFPNDHSSGLWTANIDGTSARRLAIRRDPEQFIGSPAWSPDGRTIACPMLGSDAGVSFNSIIAVRVSDGEQKELSSRHWATVGRLTWFDDDGVILNAGEQNAAGTMQLWDVSFPDGLAKPITHDLNSYSDVSLTSDSSTLVTVQSEVQSNVFVTPAGDDDHFKQLTTAKGSDGTDVSWTPDGRILYDSLAGGNSDIWVIRADGTEPRRLTSDAGADYSAQTSPDGRYIVFSSNRSGAGHVWRMNADGSNPKQLSNGNGIETSGVFVPDGRFVLYSILGNTSRVLKISVDGGIPESLSGENDASEPVVSPNGESLAYWYWADYKGGARQQIGLMNISGGSPLKTFKPPPTAVTNVRVQFSADGHSIFYLDTRNGVSNIWSQPLDGGQPKQVTHFKTHTIFGFSYSPDGKQLAFTKGDTTSDVVLISGFKK